MITRPDFRASPRARCSLFCSRALLFCKLWARQALSHWDRYKALKLIELNISKIVKFWVVFLFFHELTDWYVVIILSWHHVISSCYHKYRLISCDMNEKFGVTFLPGSRFSSRALSNCGQRARLAQSKKSLKSGLVIGQLLHRWLWWIQAYCNKHILATWCIMCDLHTGVTDIQTDQRTSLRTNRPINGQTFL